jgi:hypothetical protein
MGIARSASQRGGIAAEQANAPDRRHAASHIPSRGWAAGDWRRYAASERLMFLNMRSEVSCCQEAWRRLRDIIEGQPNNGMHPTPHHELSYARCAGARVMPGVGLLRSS